MISVAEALATVLAEVHPVGTCDVHLVQPCGRVLADAASAAR